MYLSAVCVSLSAKNGWIDKNGRVYIIFTIDEAKMALNCAEQKAINMDVETIAVIKKNSKKYNTKGCVKVMGELS